MNILLKPLRFDKYVLSIIALLCLIQFILAIRMVGYNIPLATFVLGITIIATILICIDSFRFKWTRRVLALTLYIIFSFFSLTSYLLPSVHVPVPKDIKLFLIAFILELLPVTLYFISNHACRHHRRMIENVLIFSNTVVIVIGIMFYIFRPEFYTDFMFREFIGLNKVKNGISPLDIVASYTRLMSYVGSTSIGIITVNTVALLLSRVNKSPLTLILIVLHSLCGILSMQRSAWISLVVVFFIHFVLSIVLQIGLCFSLKLECSF